MAALDAPLDPSRVRVGAVGPLDGVPYLDGEDVIRRANEIFGYGAWGFRVLGLPERIEAGTRGSGTEYEVWAVAGELTVRGCEPVGDVGTNTRNGKGGEGLEMAFKGAATDCLKRCLVRYGDQFGLVLRDKDVHGADLRQRYEAWQSGQSAPPPAAENPAPPPVSPARPAGLPEGIVRTGNALEEMGLDWNHDIVRSLLADGARFPLPQRITPENVRDVFGRWMAVSSGRKPSVFLAHCKDALEREQGRTS